eukprot:GHVN01054867.1.p1 GENE.GHVN01054867.1~~GHVN01054867.1.p1  ORF type:complete len:139 (+),score=13.77 GHVN01054867.1:66-482(+)
MFRHVITVGRQAVLCMPSRQFGATAMLAQQKQATISDPIQKLFIDKIHEYSKKATSAPDGLYECTDDARKALQAELDAVSRVFKSDFPNLPKYTDVELEERTIEAQKVAELAVSEDVAAVVENPERIFHEPLQKADFI